MRIPSSQTDIQDFFRHTVAWETPSWNFLTCSLIINGKFSECTKSNPSLFISSSSLLELLTSLFDESKYPPIHFDVGVHPFNQEYGDTSTTVPCGLSIDGRRFRNFIGSGNRHKRLAARMVSTSAKFSGKLHASP